MALEAAAVSASAALGCSTIGIAAYSNVYRWTHREGRVNNTDEEAQGCAELLLRSVAGSVQKVQEMPQLCRSAFTDPQEEIRNLQIKPFLAKAAECSVDGHSLKSGFVSCDGEVVNVGRDFANAEPCVALGGAEVDVCGKTVTITPHQAPMLVLQLDSQEEATQVGSDMKMKAASLSSPVARLSHFRREAHDLCVHNADLQSRIVVAESHGHKHKAGGHGHGHGHGHDNGHGNASDHGDSNCASHGDGHAPCNHGAPSHGAEHPTKGVGMDDGAELLEQLRVMETSNMALEAQLMQARKDLAEMERQKIQCKAEVEMLRHHQRHSEASVANEEAAMRARGDMERQFKNLKKRAEEQEDSLSAEIAKLSQKAAVDTAKLKELMEENAELQRKYAAALAGDSVLGAGEVAEANGENVQALMAENKELRRIVEESEVALGSSQGVAAENEKLQRRLEEVTTVATNSQAEAALLQVEAARASKDVAAARQALAEQETRAKEIETSHQEQLRSMREEVEVYRLRAEKANLELQSGEKPSTPDTDSGIFSPKGPSLPDTDLNSFSPKGKLSPWELQAMKAHLQSVHKRVGAAEAKSRSLEKDAAAKEPLKQLLQHQREHYEEQLQELRSQLDVLKRKDVNDNAQASSSSFQSPSDLRVEAAVAQFKTLRAEEQEQARNQTLGLGSSFSSRAPPTSAPTSSRQFPISTDPGVYSKEPSVPFLQWPSGAASSASSPYSQQSARPTVKVLANPVVSNLTPPGSFTGVGAYVAGKSTPNGNIRVSRGEISPGAVSVSSTPVPGAPRSALMTLPPPRLTYGA